MDDLNYNSVAEEGKPIGQTRPDVSQKFSAAIFDAWTVYNLLAVLFEAMPDDGFDGLPVKCTVSHIMDLAKKMPDTLGLIEREVRRG